MGESNNSTQSVADYLAQLLKDRKQLAAFPNLFLHVERVVDEEIIRVRSNLFHIHGIAKQPLELPEADGTAVTLSEKVYVPVKEHPDFNFVGRILGPRGMTAKQLEQETGCKIMVRGRGSMRDKKKEEMNRGKPNWEHLNDELHVLITVEDTENRAHMKLQRAVEEITRLLVPSPDGEDELKKRQLMELAIINGTYRDSSKPGMETMGVNPAQSAQAELQLQQQQQQQQPRLMTPSMQAGLASLMTSQIRTPVTMGAPLILSAQRMAAGTTLISSAGGPPPLINPADAGLLYAPYASEYAAHYAAHMAQPQLLAAAEYAAATDPTGGVAAAAAMGKQSAHRLLGQGRDHPYRRAGALC